VHKYKNIVSNNKTDAVAVEEKENCWKRITEEFNFESPNGILPLEIQNYILLKTKKLFEDFSLT
jgi:hypothetical protein